MKRLLTLLALLVLPVAVAPAKELHSAQVCGPAGCAEADNRAAIIRAIEDGGPPNAPPQKQAPFYRVKVVIRGAPGTHRLLVSPGARRLRGFDGATWFEIPERHLAAWRAAARGVEPFPAAQLPGVDPSAPQPNPGGSLEPQTYRVAPAERPAAAGDDHGGFPWWVVALAAAAAALVLGARTRLPRPSSDHAA